jgi:MFS family permease
VGNVIGVFFITPLSDIFGRRWAMFFGSIVAIIGTALCTGANSGMPNHRWSSFQLLTSVVGLFIAGRIFLGLGGVVVGAIGPV